MKRAQVKEVITPVAKPKLERVKPPVVKKTEEIVVKKEIEPIIEVEEKREDVIMTKLPEKEIALIPIRPKLKYKLKAGKLRIFKTNYKSGDIITAYPEEIPEVFKNSLICISDPELQKEVADALFHISGKETLYDVKPSKSGGWFNVVNQDTGKQINEKALTKGDAEKLCKSLNV